MRVFTNAPGLGLVTALLVVSSTAVWSAPASPITTSSWLWDAGDVLDRVSSLVGGASREMLEQRAQSVVGRPVRIGEVSLTAAGVLRLERVEIAGDASHQKTLLAVATLGAATSPVVTVMGLESRVDIGGKLRGVRLDEASYGIKSGLLTITRGRITMEAGPLALRGLVRRDAREIVLEGLHVDGPLALAGHVEGLDGEAEISLVGRGPLKAVRLEGAVKSPRLSFNGRVIRSLKGRFVHSSTELRVDGFEADLDEGRLSGSFSRSRSPGGARTRFDVVVTGIDATRLKSAAVTRGQGRLSLAGTIGKDLASADAVGRFDISGLSIDLSRAGAVAGYREQIAAVGRAGGILEGVQLPARSAGPVDGLLKQLRYYQAVLAEVSRPQLVGDATSPVQMGAGIVRLTGLTGTGLAGAFSYRIKSKTIDGRLEKLKLGRVTLVAVGIRGPISRPTIGLGRENLQLDGEPAPPIPSLEGVAGSLGLTGKDRLGPVAGQILEQLIKGAGPSDAGGTSAGALLDILRRAGDGASPADASEDDDDESDAPRAVSPPPGPRSSGMDREAVRLRLEQLLKGVR